MSGENTKAVVNNGKSEIYKSVKGDLCQMSKLQYDNFWERLKLGLLKMDLTIREIPHCLCGFGMKQRVLWFFGL